MKINKILSRSLSAVFLMALLLSAGAVHALELKTDVKVDTKADVNANGNANVNANTNTNANDNANADSNNSVNANTNATLNANSNSMVANISTDDDLKVYTTSLKNEDKNVSKVEVADNQILLAYRQPAKFLGFIPSNVTAKVMVDAQGNISVNYPWYTFLSVKNDEKLKADLQMQVAAVLGNGRGADDTAVGTTTIAFSDLSVRSRAKIIQALHTALKSNVSAEVKSEAEVK